MEDKFDENYDVTIGMDFKSKKMNIEGEEYTLALWDTAGAERFRSLTPSFYRKAMGAILVYDITSRESLAKLEAWLNELENYSDNPNICTIVVGNKLDKERIISREEGQRFAKKNRALFLETSAKCDQNVADAFREIAEKVSSIKVLHVHIIFLYFSCRLLVHNILWIPSQAVVWMLVMIRINMKAGVVVKDVDCIYVFLFSFVCQGTKDIQFFFIYLHIQYCLYHKNIKFCL